MNEDRPIPLISLYGNLIVSIQVTLSDPLVERLTADVTRIIEEQPISGLIIDLTGVDLMDSHITHCLQNLAVTSRLMGVETVLCGMQPAVVMTLVEMGFLLQGVFRAVNLERALELLIERAAARQAPYAFAGN